MGFLEARKERSFPQVNLIIRKIPQRLAECEISREKGTRGFLGRISNEEEFLGFLEEREVESFPRDKSMIHKIPLRLGGCGVSRGR